MKQNRQLEKNEIDLVELLATIYKSRKVIIIVTAVFLIFGLLVALLSPVEYKAEITFVPQTTEDSVVNSSLSGLAAFAGINLRSSESSSQIPPSLYPTILESTTFKKIFLNAIITTDTSEQLTVKEYLQNNSSGPGIVSRIITGVKSILLPARTTKYETTEFNGLTNAEYALGKTVVENLLTVTVNEEEGGLINLTMIDSNPFMAAILGEKAFSLLEQTVISFKVENAKKVYDFVSTQYLIKQKEFEAIQEELALFSDRNKNINTALFENERQRLQTRYDLSYSVYQELAKQKIQAELQVSKDTPIFSILNPITPPKEKDAPRRTFILVIYTLIGLVVSSIYVLIKKPLIQIVKQITK